MLGDVKWTCSEADYYDGGGQMQKVTHLAIGAHQDDLEIMAADGIKKGFLSEQLNFAGVVCTDGGGSARAGEYSDFTDQQMREERKKEQKKAAELGRYSFVAQLGYPSSQIKNQSCMSLIDELALIIDRCKPEEIYTHNPFDKHQTHVGVMWHVVQALKKINYVPQGLYGCEVWRDLDWLDDQRKVVFDLTGFGEQIQKLIACHKSQTAGGKRYDLATLGRMKSHATFLSSHEIDQIELAWYAVDLKPLLAKDASVDDYIKSHLRSFEQSVTSAFSEFSWK